MVTNFQVVIFFINRLNPDFFTCRCCENNDISRFSGPWILSLVQEITWLLKILISGRWPAPHPDVSIQYNFVVWQNSYPTIVLKLYFSYVVRAFRPCPEIAVLGLSEPPNRPRNSRSFQSLVIFFNKTKYQNVIECKSLSTALITTRCRSVSTVISTSPGSDLLITLFIYRENRRSQNTITYKYNKIRN